uniref:Clr2_transil domain-containing protein n=1 Tax=Panagrellus redivivus TaxID=6233 RepID=A0A7E4VCF7_PANRE
MSTEDFSWDHPEIKELFEAFLEPNHFPGAAKDFHDLRTRISTKFPGTVITIPDVQHNFAQFQLIHENEYASVPSFYYALANADTGKWMVYYHADPFRVKVMYYFRDGKDERKRLKCSSCCRYGYVLHGKLYTLAHRSTCKGQLWIDFLNRQNERLHSYREKHGTQWFFAGPK